MGIAHAHLSIMRPNMMDKNVCMNCMSLNNPISKVLLPLDPAY